DEGALPIQLAYLTAQMSTNGRSLQVNWGTLTEVNNYGFWVEKSPNDQAHYQTISGSFTPGHGTTNEPQHYSFTDNNISSGVWYYRLKQQDLDGTIHYTEGVQIDILTSVKELAPKEFALLQNYPNPFNPSTEIKFSVEVNGLATLKIYNVLGQEVATLFNEIAEAGQYYKVRLDANNLASGVYFYKLESGQKKDLKKMLLLK
ncbi:MAG: T9SS type A sorting domain-containing protein, partial [Bacteroidota bacterium]